MKRSFIIEVIVGNGFTLLRNSKHGDIYVNNNNQRRTTIGRHYRNDTIPKGTLKAIENQTGLRFRYV